MNNAPPRILAIETSGAVGSVAVALGGQWLGEARLAEASRHAGDLLPVVARLWREQGWRPEEMDCCIVSIGPGSFTGLRVAVTVARHLALAVGASIVAVPTLDVIAEEGADSVPVGECIAVMLDAKRDQVFGATYRRDAEGMTALSAAAMLAPLELLSREPRPSWATGEGAAHYHAVIEAHAVRVLDRERWWPQARTVHRLGWPRVQRGEFIAPQYLTPLYIRRPEAEEIWDRREAAAADAANSPVSPPYKGGAGGG